MPAIGRIKRKYETEDEKAQQARDRVKQNIDDFALRNGSSVYCLG